MRDDRPIGLAAVDPGRAGAGGVACPRALAVVALLAIAGCLFAVPSRPEWDSKQVYVGLANLIEWGRGGFVGPVDPKNFPPFQYLTGLPVALAGGADPREHVLRFWAFSSFLGLAGTAWLLWRVGRRCASTAVAWLLVVVVLSGALITYVKSTFNELPAALLMAGLAAAVVGSGGPVGSAGLFIAAGLTKEIAAPLLVPIWLAGLWLRRAELGRAGIVRHLIALTVAFAITVAAHASFNLLRYGSVLNRYYLSEACLIRPWDRRGENVVALWLAPNGGVVAFWPTIVAIVVVVAMVAVRRRTALASLNEGRIARLVPAAMVVATIGGLTIGLSGFFEPFGWWCWGPRHLLPWLPAGLIVLVRAYPSSFNRAARVLLERRGAFVATVAFACVTAMPHVFMVLARPLSVHDFHLPDMQFPRGAPAHEPELHYMRLVFLAWLKWPPQLLVPLLHAPPTRALVEGLVYLAGVLVLLWRARTKLASQGSTTTDSAFAALASDSSSVANERPVRMASSR